MTTAYDKTKNLENSAGDSSDEMKVTVEGQIEISTMHEVSVNDQSEHGEAKNASEDSVKVFVCVLTTL